MDKLGAMNAFAKVIALGSFAQAARALGTTRSAASKAVMELEYVLGVRLLDRTTRRVGPTEAGLAYYERCLDILARVEETELQVARLHGEPRGVLRLNGPASFGALYLAPAVAEFLGRHPNLKIELTLTDRFIDPIEEGADVTIRIAELAESSLIARRLAPARRAFVASPSYLATHGEPAAPDDLARHACLTYGHTTTLQRWRIVRDGEAINVPINSVLCSNSGDVLRAAALSGQGVAFLPTFLIGRDIRSGSLRTVLDRFPQPALAVHALFASNRYLAAKTRAFVDFLAGRFGEEPEWDRFLGSLR
jgi:DNA-binding transcriptional LysR family regulator